jgi:hypothetical protein
VTAEAAVQRGMLYPEYLARKIAAHREAAAKARPEPSRGREEAKPASETRLTTLRRQREIAKAAIAMAAIRQGGWFESRYLDPYVAQVAAIDARIARACRPRRNLRALWKETLCRQMSRSGSSWFMPRPLSKAYSRLARGPG